MSTIIETIDDILTHHGIKGMKWGVRRARGSGGPSAVTVTQKGKRVKVSGGERHPAHEDAIAARVAKQKLKKSGSASLSNAEMQKLATRMNLEQQVSRLNKGTSPYKDGQKFVQDFAKKPEGKLAINLAKNAANTPQGKQLISKAAATVVTSAALAVSVRKKTK